MFMLQIDETIISQDIVTKKFACDITKCKGACCVHGDSGAPLEEEEIILIQSIFSVITPFMRPEAITAVEKQGVFIIDSDGDMVTPLVNGQECCYATYKDGIALCIFEIAFRSNLIGFKKPISCHVYP